MAESRHPFRFPKLQALLVTFLWSTSWVLIKLGLEQIPAISFAAMRYTLAFLVLALALLASPDRRAELRRLDRSDWLRLSLLGVVFYSLTQGAQFLALAFLPAVTLSLMLSFSPAAVALLGASFLGEHLTRRQWFGVAVFLLGALLYFLPLAMPVQAVGLAVAAVGLLANSGASLLGRSINRRGDLHPLLVTVVSMGVGSLLLLVVGLTVEGLPHLDLTGWGIVVWLAIVNTALAFTLWNHTLRSLTALESTLINNTMLVQIALLAWIFLGEAISARESIGLILAVAGVLAVQLAGDHKKAQSGPPDKHQAVASERPSARLRSVLLVVILGLAAGFAGCARAPAQGPVPVKIVVVTMWEIGDDEGDRAGELQLWKERQQLHTRFEMPGAAHDVFMNLETGVMGMVTGIGTTRAAASTMAVGLDPRFDLRQSYWLIAGIAGFDPEDASIGSAAWAEYLVDADLAHEIDAREIPEGWSTGYFPRHTSMPFDPDRPDPAGEVYQLNPELTEWAYQLTKDIDLGDDEKIAKHRARYTGHPNARRPPFVLKGDNLSGLTFWHGSLLNQWANGWVTYWTGGNGSFVSSAMEDTGTSLALSRLHEAGRVDRSRVLVLRTASNYTVPPPGVSAAENLTREHSGFSGLGIAIESAYRVGAPVVDEIVKGWETYRTTVPGSDSSGRSNRHDG